MLITPNMPIQVRSLRSNFEEIQGSSVIENVRVKDVFEVYLKHELTPIVKWIVDAVKPKRQTELSFSEYVR